MATEIGLATNLITRVNVGDSLTRTADRFPDQLAVVDGARRFTYRQLNTEVSRLANSLRAAGYTRGDAITLAAGNCAEFLVTYYACAKVGVVCVPLNLGWRADEIAFVLDHSESRAVVVEQQLLPLVQPAIEKVPAVRDIVVNGGTPANEGVAGGGGTGFEASLPDRVWHAFADLLGDDAAEPEVFVDDRDPISYLYTSGTTSFPKGVVGSHLAIYLESLMVCAESSLTREDRIACLMPLFHTAQPVGVPPPIAA